jgi:hypothetical protein
MPRLADRKALTGRIVFPDFVGIISIILEKLALSFRLRLQTIGGTLQS